MTAIALRAARRVRIHCPVAASTLADLLAGRPEVLDEDPALAAILEVIRADNPLGDFGAYQGVVEIGLGYESFRPTAEARPTLGGAGAISVCPTVTLVTYLREGAPEALVSAALAELAAAHPWEVPVIELSEVKLVERA